ncbi:glycosyltransferase family 4 protein [Noviherbaspirillum agri]
MLRLSLVSNELPPYRIPFFEALENIPGIALQVLFCTRREPNRLWELPPLDFGHVFLRENIFTVGGRYIHSNPGVIGELRKFSPDVIVTGGFNPTHLYAFAYAVAKRLPHVPMTDGTDVSEKGLSGMHRAVRRIVYARSKAFVSASDGGRRLYASYGIPAQACFKACLCVDNEAFSPQGQGQGAAPGTEQPKEYDFLFCGRIEPVKNPQFALDVALATARRIGRRVSILFVGTGVQEEEIQGRAAQHPDLVQAVFRGFTAHGDLPALYRSARVFLFPSLWDPWGVVANEACAAGLPVLVSPEPGVANELVVDGRNGFVRQLDVEDWAERAAMLLTQPAQWQRFSQNSLAAVREYTYANAAAGLVAACRHAVEQMPRAQLGAAERYNEK